MLRKILADNTKKRAEQNISALPNICPAPLINQIAGCRLVRRAERAESG